MKKTIRMGDLRDVGGVADHLRDIVEWKNLLIEGGYHHEPIDAEKMLTWLRTYGKPLLPYICDTSEYLSKAADEGKRYSLKLSSAHSGILITAFIRIPRRQTASPHFRLSARVFRSYILTRA